MTSIIDAFNSNPNLYFSVSSSTPLTSSRKPESAFNKEGNWFESTESNAFWQISFSRPVSIESYVIGGLSIWDCWPTSWEISYSLDNLSFKTKQIDEIDDLRGKTKKFSINQPIYCKHLKITGKTTTNPKYPTSLWFYRFDCFGTIRYKRTENLYNATRNKIISILRN